MSPRPMPSTKRPPDVSCTVAATLASAAGWRVNALVTPVANRSRSVASAASATATNGSPTRFCESVNVMPSQPSALGPLGLGDDGPDLRDPHRPQLEAARRERRSRHDDRAECAWGASRPATRPARMTGAGTDALLAP